MDVQEAVHIAKDWVNTIFREEQISRLGLEEVEHDVVIGVWRVTLGFSRQWNENFAGIPLPAPRTFKTVTINELTGEVESMRSRDPV